MKKFSKLRFRVKYVNWFVYFNDLIGVESFIYDVRCGVEGMYVRNIMFIGYDGKIVLVE